MALRAGLSLKAFYSLTPFQVSLHLKAWNLNRTDEIEHQMLQAYHTGALTLYQNDPSKFPESFDKWMGKETRRKVQTEKEASAAILLWARKNGLKE